MLSAESTERLKLDAELMLGGGYLMVMLFHRHTHLRHVHQHVGAQVLGGVDRRHGEIAALGSHAVAEVAALVLGIVVRRQF
jgi:hypothetical protein